MIGRDLVGFIHLNVAYRCFNGVTLKTFFSETNLRRALWKFGVIPIDQTS